jgi:xanthine dehydrogenase accessory factor
MRDRDIYRQLLTVLREGDRAAVASRFESGRVAKRLVREGDANEWTSLAAADGPLAFAQDGGGISLTEYYEPRPRLLVLGCGHIARALTAMAAMIDFDVVVFDDRPIFADRTHFPLAREVICDSFVNAMERLKIRKNDYVVIVTRGHQHDTLCLRGALSGTLPYYIGMIGSRRRVAIVRKQLADEGFPPADIAKVHSPIGLRIGAVTPQEITVSILAEIIRHKRLGPAWAAESDACAAQCARASDVDLAEWLADERNSADALITVVRTRGSTPRESGAKMAVSYDGTFVGTIGGGCAEAGVLRDARNVIRNGGYSVKTVDLTDSAEEDGMVCGGEMTILIESLGSAP